MTSNELQQSNEYLIPTPGGVYHSVVSIKNEDLSQYIQALMRNQTSLISDDSTLLTWQSISDQKSISQIALKYNWVEVQQSPLTAPDGQLDDILPNLLPPLSHNQRILLADNQGFVICSVGFDERLTGELAAFTADITSLLDRHSFLLTKKLKIPGHAVGLIGAGGQSQLGIWPLYIRKQPFALVIEGEPNFNCNAFRDLIWMLLLRYRETE